MQSRNMYRRAPARLALVIASLAAAPLVTAPAFAGGDGIADIAAEAANPAPDATAGQSADGYLVRLSRPMKVAQKFQYTSDATLVDSATGTVSGRVKTLTPRTVTVHLDGQSEILAVNPKGKVTKMRITVAECVARSGKERRTIVPPGRVVTAEAGKFKTKLMLDSGSLTIEDDLILRAVVYLPKLDDVTDDEIAGTSQRQKVGQTWDVHPDQIQRAWAAAGVKLKRSQISGNAKVKGVEAIDGVQCLRVTGRIKVDHFLFPASEIPDGAKVEDASYEEKFTRLAPVDLSAPMLVESHSSKIEAVITNSPDAIAPDVKVSTRRLITVGVKLRPLVADYNASARPEE